MKNPSFLPQLAPSAGNRPSRPAGRFGSAKMAADSAQPCRVVSAPAGWWATQMDSPRQVVEIAIRPCRTSRPTHYRGSPSGCRLFPADPIPHSQPDRAPGPLGYRKREIKTVDGVEHRLKESPRTRTTGQLKSISWRTSPPDNASGGIPLHRNNAPTQWRPSRVKSPKGIVPRSRRSPPGPLRRPARPIGTRHSSCGTAGDPRYAHGTGTRSANNRSTIRPPCP